MAVTYNRPEELLEKRVDALERYQALVHRQPLYRHQLSWALHHKLGLLQRVGGLQVSTPLLNLHGSGVTLQVTCYGVGACLLIYDERVRAQQPTAMWTANGLVEGCAELQSSGKLVPLRVGELPPPLATLLDRALPQ